MAVGLYAVSMSMASPNHARYMPHLRTRRCLPRIVSTPAVVEAAEAGRPLAEGDGG